MLRLERGSPVSCGRADGVQVRIQVEIAQQQVLLELRGASERRAGVIDDE